MRADCHAEPSERCVQEQGWVRLLLLDLPVSLLWVFITQVNVNAAQSGFAEE